MQQVLTPADFASARAIQSAKLGELGFNPVCMAPGAENPGHSHTLVEEILIVRSGTGKIQIENEMHELCAGSVAIVPAGKFHALCNTGSVNLEGITIFNRNVDRKKVVLKNRKQHFKAVSRQSAASKEKALSDELAALTKANRKLKKAIKKLKKR